MTTHTVIDTTRDEPHRQRDRSVACRSCLAPTYRAHAVCAGCVDPDEQFGCCARCAPQFFGPTS
jgi:hypothetical protein